MVGVTCVRPNDYFLYRFNPIVQESIETDPWWLHNGGSAMQAFPEAPGTLVFSRFPDFPISHPPLGGKSGNRETRKKKL